MLTPRKTDIFKKYWALWIWGAIVVVGGIVVLLAGIAAMSTGLVGAYTAFSVTEHPKFCAAMCHNMRPLYDSWGASTHKGVRCAECHNEPGVKGFLAGAVVAPIKESIQYYLTHDYGKEPLVVEMSGKSCLTGACHKIERVAEKPLLYRGTLFKHGAHLDIPLSWGPLRCTHCHFKDDQKHMQANSALCFLCHLNPKKNPSKITLSDPPSDCRSCHQIVLSTENMDHAGVFAEGMACTDCHEMPAGGGAVLSERCERCHREKPRELKTEESVHLHGIHVGSTSVRCFECHEQSTHKAD